MMKNMFLFLVVFGVGITAKGQLLMDFRFNDLYLTPLASARNDVTGGANFDDGFGEQSFSLGRGTFRFASYQFAPVVAYAAIPFFSTGKLYFRQDFKSWWLDGDDYTEIFKISFIDQRDSFFNTAAIVLERTSDEILELRGEADGDGVDILPVFNFSARGEKFPISFVLELDLNLNIYKVHWRQGNMLSSWRELGVAALDSTRPDIGYIRLLLGGDFEIDVSYCEDNNRDPDYFEVSRLRVGRRGSDVNFPTN